MSFAEIPPRHTARYKAGAFIHQSGPATEAQILAAVHFGVNPGSARESLRLAIELRWLVYLPSGLIGCGEVAAAHYAKVAAPKPKPLEGPKVPARHIDVINRKAWVPPKRFVPRDTEDCSWRAKPSHHAKVAG